MFCIKGILIFAILLCTFYGFNSAFAQDSTEISMLVKIYDEDVKIRDEWYISDYRNGRKAPKTDSLLKVMRYTDSLHIIYVKDFLDKYGFQGFSSVGKKAATAQWIVIQHSMDMELMEKYLDVMWQLARKDDFYLAYAALLEDRILVTKGLKQIYGTQKVWNEEKQKFETAPIEDPEHLDERRKGIF